MPKLAPTICPRCHCHKPSGTRCACQPPRADARPGADRRGYDAEYQAKAKAFLADHRTCACGRPATLVRHVISIRRRPDLRLDQSNWRPGCRSCNANDAHADKSEIADKDRGVGRGLAERSHNRAPYSLQISAENIGPGFFEAVPC